MKFPSIKKLSREDFPDAPDWFGKVTDALNPFMEATFQAFNRNVTDEENIACQIYDLVYRTPSTYPTADKVSFQRTLKTKATGLTVLQCVEKTTYTPAAGPVYVPWVDNNGQITLSSITGLEASKTYLIRLRVT